MPWCQGASQHAALGRIQACKKASKTGDDAVGVQGWGEISVRNAGTPVTALLCRRQALHKRRQSLQLQHQHHVRMPETSPGCDRSAAWTL